MDHVQRRGSLRDHLYHAGGLFNIVQGYLGKPPKTSLTFTILIPDTAYNVFIWGFMPAVDRQTRGTSPSRPHSKQLWVRSRSESLQYPTKKYKSGNLESLTRLPAFFAPSPLSPFRRFAVSPCRPFAASPIRL
jgi:hypothetical protein